MLSLQQKLPLPVDGVRDDELEPCSLFLNNRRERITSASAINVRSPKPRNRKYPTSI